MTEETRAVLAPGLGIRVTEATKSGDTLLFVVRTQEFSSREEHCVNRTFQDFEWLQHCLYTQEVPGIQGVIFPPLPAKPCALPSNSQAKTIKQLGFLGLGEDWQTYCMALEKYLQLVAVHATLSKNKALQRFLTETEDSGRQPVRRGIFDRLSQVLGEMRNEGHKDVDDFFQSERESNFSLTGISKAATEKFLDIVLAEEKIAVACGHFSTSLHLGIGEEADPTAIAFSKLCLRLSEIMDTVKKNFENVAKNNINTLGLGLDLDSRYQEAEKEMLFRRISKLVELENAKKNLEKAKPVKKAAMEEIKTATEKEFNLLSDVAKLEIESFRALRVKAYQQFLTAWCERQLQTARENSFLLTQQLATFRQLASE